MRSAIVLRSAALVALLAVIAVSVIGKNGDRLAAQATGDDCRTTVDADPEEPQLGEQVESPITLERVPIAAEQSSAEPASEEDVIEGDDAERLQVEFRVKGLQSGRANLEIWHSDTGPNHPEKMSARQTDTQGRLVVELPPGRIRVSAFAGMLFANPIETQLTKSLERRVIEMDLETAGIVEGRIVSAIDGIPIVGAHLQIPLLRESEGIRTDSSGWYRLPLPKDGGGYTIKADAEGYAADSITIGFFPSNRWIREIVGPDRPGVNAVHPEGTGVARVDFELRQKGRIDGQVVLPDGGGAEGASIKVQGYSWSGYGVASPSRGLAIADADGDFSIQELLPDITYTLTVHLDSFATRPLVVPPSNQPDRSIGRVRLEVAGSWTGRVVDARGVGIGALEVRLGEGENPGYQSGKDPRFPRDSELSQPQKQTSITTGDGEFKLLGLASGTYRLSVLLGNKKIYSRDVALFPGERRLEEVLLPDPFLEITGVVKSGVGVLAGARVVLQSSKEFHVYTDENGNFEFRGLKDPLVWYQLSAGWKDATGHEWASSTVEVRPDGPPVQLEIEGPGKPD